MEFNIKYSKELKFQKYISIGSKYLKHFFNNLFKNNLLKKIIYKKHTSLISLCCCCKLCTVGCAAEGIVMAGLNVGLGCGLGTETGVLPTGGCCFFLKESFINGKQKDDKN